MDEHLAARPKEQIRRQAGLQLRELGVDPKCIIRRMGFYDPALDLKPENLLRRNQQHAIALAAHDLPEQPRRIIRDLAQTFAFGWGQKGDSGSNVFEAQ